MYDPADPDTPDTPDAAERRYRAPALEKGLDILELLASHGAAMTASQISVALDRSISELFRMIQVLEYRGYIAAAQGGEGYELSNRLFALGMARAPVRNLIEASLPVMRELTLQIRQSCHLAIASDDHIVVIARMEGPGYVGFSVRPGHRRALAEATSGAVLFAFQPPEARRAWLERLPGLSGEARARFVARTEAVRARGHEHAASDYVHGVIDIAAPILDGEVAVAALTVPFVQTHPTPVPIETAIEHLKVAAARISREVASSL